MPDLYPDGARAPRRRERPAGERSRLRRRSAPSAWSSASSTSPTWSPCPSTTALTAGRWLDAARARAVGRAGHRRAPRLALGDELSWNVGGETVSARITSFRKLRWDSMKVNFFVIAPPRVLEGLPTSFVSAFRIEPGGEAVLNELSARFPNLTIVDVAAAVRQAQEVVDQLVSAVQFIFLFALGAGLLVLYSALVATEDERRREAAVMRVYGASRAQVTGAQRVEFLAMGALAGAPRDARRRGDRPAPRAARVRARPAAEPRAVGRRPARRHRAALAQRLALLAQGAARLAGAHAARLCIECVRMRMDSACLLGICRVGGVSGRARRARRVALASRRDRADQRPASEKDRPAQAADAAATARRPSRPWSRRWKSACGAFPSSSRSSSGYQAAREENARLLQALNLERRQADEKLKLLAEAKTGAHRAVPEPRQPHLRGEGREAGAAERRQPGFAAAGPSASG